MAIKPRYKTQADEDIDEPLIDRLPIPHGHTPIRHDDKGVTSISHDGEIHHIKPDGSFHVPHHAAQHFIHAHGFKVAS